MRRAPLMLLLVMSSCSFLRAAGVPTDVSSGLAAAPGIAADVQKVKECQAIGDRDVPFPEERSIGGAVALNLAIRAGPVYTELSPAVANLNASQLTDYGKKIEKSAEKAPPGAGPKTDLNKYLNTLGLQLAALSERPTLPWTFAVLDSNDANAFSAPGGYVFVTRGMLKKLENEAQLAGVLAHEIGHVTGRHAIKAYQGSKKLSCYCAHFGGKALDGAVKGAMGSLGDSVKALPFAAEVLKSIGGSTFDPDSLSGGFIEFLADKAGDTIYNEGLGKDFEFDADRTAARIMVFAGYDTKEFEKLLSKLPDGGGFLTPHPANAERIKVVSEVRGELGDFGGPPRAPPLPPIASK
ncbi:MAG: M48 family metalloprotease [Myxococcota bacterium]